MHDVYVDSQPPLDQTNVQADWYTTSPVTIDVEGTDVTSGIQSVRWRKGTSGLFTEVTGASTPVTFSGDGQHVLETELVDKAGHVSATEHHTVKIDTTDPVDTTLPAPALTVNSPHSVTVSGTDVAGSGVDHVEWKVNGGPLQTGPSNTQVTLVGHGDAAAKLETRIVDNAGRASAWTTRTYDLDAYNDTTPPVVITDPADPHWITYPLDVEVEADDQSGIGVRNIQWNVENVKHPEGLEDQTANADRVTIPLHNEGEYLVRTWANDKKGNKSAEQAQTFRIDLKVPVDTTDIPTGWQSSRTFKLEATDTASGVDRIEYSVSNGLSGSLASDKTVDVGADGKFIVTTRVFDLAGQRSAIKTAPFWVDTAKPSDVTPEPPAGWLGAPLTYEVTDATGADDALSGFNFVRWQVDEGEIHEGGPAVVDTDGPHTLKTQVVDNAGNAGPWRSFDVSIDQTAPENTTRAAPTGWLKAPYTVEITGDDGASRSGVDKIEVELDGKAVSTPVTITGDGKAVSNPVTITGDGEHTLLSRLIDKVGNVSERTEKIRIDTAAPKAALSCSAGPDVWSSAPVSCTVTADGGDSKLASATLSGADGGTASVTSGATAWVSSDGTHTLRLEAADGADNRAGATAVVNVDRTAPGAGLSCAAADGKYSCVATASDALSGVSAARAGASTAARSSRSPPAPSSPSRRASFASAPPTPPATCSSPRRSRWRRSRTAPRCGSRTSPSTSPAATRPRACWAR